MMKAMTLGACAILLSVPLFGCLDSGLPVQERISTADYAKADIRLGAQLYDNWPKLKKESFGREHPLYPRKKRWGATDTWRCKECHGWDYLGKAGQYREGRHYTGYPGVFQARSQEPGALFQKIADGGSSHRFQNYLSDQEVWALVRFIREGSVDVRPLITPEGEILGDPGRGQSLYNQNCLSCHGADGEKIDLRKKRDGIQGLGWRVVSGPQQSLHRTLWGMPGGKMPAAAVKMNVSATEAADILAHVRKLRPAANLLKAAKEQQH